MGHRVFHVGRRSPVEREGRPKRTLGPSVRRDWSGLPYGSTTETYFRLLGFAVPCLTNPTCDALLCKRRGSREKYGFTDVIRPSYTGYCQLGTVGSGRVSVAVSSRRVPTTERHVYVHLRPGLFLRLRFGGGGCLWFFPLLFFSSTIFLWGYNFPKMVPSLPHLHH